MTKLDYRLQCTLKDGEMQRAQFEARDFKTENERLRALLEKALPNLPFVHSTSGAPSLTFEIRAALAAPKG
jgi:hypothetical protein